MHDPVTLAFEIKRPWPRKTTGMGGFKYYPAIFEIWHVDPERDGSDDSCDWFGSKRKLKKDEKAIIEQMWVMESILDREPFYPDHRAHKEFRVLDGLVREWRQRRPRFRIHPRWHFWHWRIRIPWVTDFKRWAFSRCATCGERFKFGEVAYTNTWHGTGPRWFRAEKDIHHGRHIGPVTDKQV